MKILFVTCLYPHEFQDKFREWAQGDIQTAADVFQWGVVEGLSENADFEIVSLPAMPSYPLNSKKQFLPEGDILLNGKRVGSMLSYCNAVVYKPFSIYYRLKQYLSERLKKIYDVEEKVVILTYSIYPPYIKAVLDLKKKYKNIVLASIVTDLVDDMMNFHSNRTLLKRLQCKIEAHQTRKYYKCIDRFILVSKYMVEKITEARDKFMVLEGIARKREFLQHRSVSDTRILLYTGALDEFSGVKDLIEAFVQVKHNNCRLVICGDGPLRTSIVEAAAVDKRIIYKGRVPHNEAVRLQQEATLLINPRSSELSITRYSFPSKTMEYLMSGTPMLGYRLAGIPDEYYEHFYVIESPHVESLAKKIEEVLFLPYDELDKKAYEAYMFVNTNKTSGIQVKRMLEFLMEQ